MNEPRDYEFVERMELSVSYRPQLEAILREQFPSSLRVEAADNAADRSGTDYWLIREGGLRPLSFDAKVRTRDYKANDLALEIWSVVGRKVGWTRDPKKTTDWIIWYWADSRRFYLAPFPPLCSVFQDRWQEWSAKYKTRQQRTDRRQNSPGYLSEVVFVPIAVLEQTISGWSSGVLRAKPETEVVQLAMRYIGECIR